MKLKKRQKYNYTLYKEKRDLIIKMIKLPNLK